MEKDLVFNSQLPEYQILDQEGQGTRKNLAHLPKEILRSGTIESLISQNEDLMARLKVMVRRLAQTEDENGKFATESRELRTHFTALSDQILILKEKDELWKKRTRRAEEELEKLKSESNLREIEYAEMRSDLLLQKRNLEDHKVALENEVLRLRRYRMKIKPLAREKLEQQLSRNTLLENQVQALSIKISGLEGQIEVINQQSQNLVRNAKLQIQSLEEEKRNLITAFEKERSDLRLEMTSFADINEELRKKVQLLDRSLERQDYLENRVITLERSKENMKESFDNEVTEIQGQLIEWRRRAHEAEAQRVNLQARVQESENRAQNFQELSQRLGTQLEGLRTLWTETSAEVDRLRSQNHSLERLNTELCAKLNESRNSPLE